MSDTRKKGKKKWIVIGIIVVLLLLAFLGLRSCAKSVSSQLAAADIRTAEAVTGSIATTVSGSGTLTSQEAQSITVPEGVEIDTIYVEIGDQVSAGDLLATVDAASVLSAMADTQADIDDLDSQLEDIREDTISETITAGVSGRVKKIYVEEDGSVAAAMLDNGALMLLSLDGKMALFLEGASASLGESVTVTLSNGDAYEGAVAEVTAAGVTVTLTDKGPAYGDNATVTDEDGNTLGSGQLYIHSELRVTGYTGTVSSLSVSEGDWVNAGNTLLKLTDLGHTAEYEDLLAQREELASQLQTLTALYQDNAITAPFDGTIQSVDGETAATAAASSSSSGSNGSDMSSLYAAYMSMAYDGGSQTGGFVLLGAEDETSGGTDGGSESSGDNVATAAPVTFGITAGVQVYGGSIADYEGQFTFVLLQDDEVLQQKTNDGEGIISFDTITYSQAGTYTYQLSQIAGTDSAITYDATVYTLIATVTGGEDGLEIQAEAVNADSGLVFTNVLTSALTGTGGVDTSSLLSGVDTSSLLSSYSSSLTSSYSSSLSDATGLTTGASSTTSSASSASEVTVLTIAPGETMSVSISVDELDILSLEKGQTASVTIDAIEGETFSGVVTGIDTIGASSGGVTKFTVQVDIEKTAQMLSGMNASVEITIAESDNCLLIPENALNQSGNTTYVYTTYDESSDTLGGEVEVTTGVSDGTNAEILSGLEEGDTVYYRYTEAASLFELYASMWEQGG